MVPLSCPLFLYYTFVLYHFYSTLFHIFDHPHYPYINPHPFSITIFWPKLCYLWPSYMNPIWPFKYTCLLVLGYGSIFLHCPYFIPTSISRISLTLTSMNLWPFKLGQGHLRWSHFGGMFGCFQNSIEILQISISDEFDVDLAVTFMTFQNRSRSTYLVSMTTLWNPWIITL